MTRVFDRRRFLGAAAAVGAAGAFAPGLARAATLKAAPKSTLDDIEHVVILMQENRSFDEYFGLMSDVIGFDDPAAIPGVFKQADADLEANPSGYILPWHMDTKTTSAQAAADLDHGWFCQHLMWNNGAMDQFVLGQTFDPVVMGYFDRADVPYHWALADAFTICDRYFCSTLGPTHGNRLYLMSGTLGAEGTNGGPIFDNNNFQEGKLRWESYPESLQKAGVDWYLYQESDNFDDNMLPYFEAFKDTTTDLYRRGCSVIPSTSLLGEGTALALKRDVLAGKLPQVAYIVGAQETTEHPNATPGRGAQFIDQILQALTSDPDVWAKTLFILNYDENDGHFDHVLPPTAPMGTPGESLYSDPLTPAGYLGPVGLGFRVPLILISPFTVGPLVSSETFDHTSVIMLLEEKFGVRCPNITKWRRDTVTSLTSAINFAATPTTVVPKFPNANVLAAEAATQATLPAPTMPTKQSMPKQYTTPRRGRPSGLVS